ncbi:hypothetical protein VTN49DRAFT_4629 [Thermomyces lanuginosus]|uniref:uncharacterized protein n=1 Tax=Thermomyces lanuginosus TaxID=5541 RepID=UPI003743A456
MGLWHWYLQLSSLSNQRDERSKFDSAARLNELGLAPTEKPAGIETSLYRKFGNKGNTGSIARGIWVEPDDNGNSRNVMLRGTDMNSCFKVENMFSGPPS